MNQCSDIDTATKFVSCLKVPSDGNWTKIAKKACRLDLHVTLFRSKKLIYDNIVFPYMKAIAYKDYINFYPQYARYIQSTHRKLFIFHEADKQVNPYVVKPLKDREHVAIVGTDLCGPSRLNALLRTFLFIYGIKTQNARLTADQSSLEGMVYSPGGGPPTIGRENIYLSYKGYVESGYDASTYVILRTFSYDATNQSVNLEWTWNAIFGPNRPQPGLEYSQDDAIVILLDKCGYWRYLREYFNLSQLTSSFGPGGSKECECE